MDFGYEITIPMEEEAEYIGNMLLEFNLQSKPLSQEKPFISINRCIKDENGGIIGGILACLALWHILSIDTLWVKKEFRNQGVAKQLLSLVETEARDMGCHIVYLSTYDFQAKDFYLKNGYEIFGVLEDCPKEHKLYHLSKRL
ncbi:GNAT family N-acetyltransferase [Clostridium botulinum]|uniref:GNAT family N-acetyltransferase n=1 Tax=Clostridium botulinum TaxID=1491 RepID=UPI003DA4F682